MDVNHVSYEEEEKIMLFYFSLLFPAIERTRESRDHPEAKVGVLLGRSV